METGLERARLRDEIERSLTRSLDPVDLLPLLARLARIAPAASDDAAFAHRQLAEILVERFPWRAALYARRAIAHNPNDDRAWAVLAFCQTLLGNFRCAAKAYSHAIASAPSNPWYAHNLGHLLDVALGTPVRALPWLRSAYAAKTDNSEIVASYVHALARAGRPALAREVLDRALARFDSRELEALLRWLDQGAPSGTKRSGELPTGRRDAHGGKSQRLTRVLTRGMLRLPLDAQQRRRAIVLAKDARLAMPEAPATAPISPRDLAEFAAAVAYAIVYVDHVPLSHAEVAAPFRVAVGQLRGTFAELRARLDLIPGDTRYATAREG